jgi:hypothetical protein
MTEASPAESWLGCAAAGRGFWLNGQRWRGFYSLTLPGRCTRTGM